MQIGVEQSIWTHWIWEVRRLLSQITGSDIDESFDVFTPLYINYGKHTKMGKNVFINFDCVFLDLGGITIEDNVLIASKVTNYDWRRWSFELVLSSKWICR